MADYTPRVRCASCDSESLRPVISLGSMPLAGCFPQSSELADTKSYPLELTFCDNCRLVQASGVVDPDILFKDYRYLSSVGLRDHFADLASTLKQQYSLNESSLVVEMGSNDGVFLAPMQALGVPARGFEPSDNVSQIARQRGCDVLHDYFSLATAKLHFAAGSTDLFVAANCFAHVDGLNDIAAGIKYLLKPDGHALIEVHDVRNVVSETQYDFIYLEHSFYYSLTSLSCLFERHDLRIVDYEEIAVHGGSLRVHVAHTGAPVAPAVLDRLKTETEVGGVATWEAYENFAAAALAHREALRRQLEECKAQGLRVVGYGASGRANVLCNFCRLDTSLVQYVVDESPERAGRFIPGAQIPILSKADFDAAEPPQVILLLAWNYSRMIMEKLRGNNFSYIIPFPQPCMVSDVAELDGLRTL